VSQTLFQNIGTEYRLFKNLLSNSTFAKPITFNVNNEITEVIKNNRPTLDEAKVKGCIMPIKFQIKTFFELPRVLNQTLDNMEMLSKSTNIKNFVNSSSFQALKLNRTSL